MVLIARRRGALKIRVEIQMYRNHTSKLYGFYVMKGMGYGVSESYGLWIKIPRLLTRWIEKPMGYKRVWVIRAMASTVSALRGDQ